MIEKIVERAFVQGTVSFRVSCNELMGLVPTEIADDDRKLEVWLEDKAFKLIDNADVSVEIDNDNRVLISEETANQLTGEIVSEDDWKKIRAENEKNKGEV
ncbi:hypothetical protein MOF01_07880 [Bacillus spizizenii]|nr:hypothetical protein [Bacillus spizizenii]